MEVAPGVENRQKREWLRRLWQSASGADPAVPIAPFRQFFATSPVSCPYVPGRAERKLIVELGGSGAALFYDDLSRAGFRRSHRFAYRPACRGCSSCVPVRIAVDRFSHTRSTRRIRNTNRDLTGRLLDARATPEQFRLFSAYQRSRHSDSDMASMSYGDYRGMVEHTPVRTAIIESRDISGELVAASLIDLLDDGVSAVYSFYDPQQPRRSLGTWSILWLVEECRRHGQPFVYLGYWISDSPKMAYKARFPALERLADGAWTEFASDIAGPLRFPPPRAGEGWGGARATDTNPMAISALDSAIFADMFGTAAMREVFGDDAFLARCIEVEAALARAQGRLGIIPPEAADAITHAANALVGGHEALDLARLKMQTETVGYPILPLVRQMAELAGESGR